MSMTSNIENKKTIESNPPRRQHTREAPFEPAFNLEQVTEPVAVPFNWEQIPGRPKDGNAAVPRPQEEASVTPRIPPGKVLEPKKQQLDVDYHAYKADFRPQIKAYSFNANVAELKYSKEGMTDDRELEDEDDDVYSDALETLSSKESASLNCSASGLSGSESAGLGRPSGTFSTDPQTRDFMMKRFLPAAKAMALEPPRYAMKKQAVAVQEQPREVKKVIGMEKKLLNDEKVPNLVQQCGDYQEEEEESEEDIDEYDNSRNIPARGCGLFPRLCFRNSLSILNPVPGLKVRTTTTRKIFYNQSDKKSVKKVSDSTYKPKSNCGFRSAELQEVENKWIGKSKSNCGFRSAELQVVEKKWVGESRRLTYSGDLGRRSSRSPPLRHSRATSISPYRNRPSQSPFRRASFLGVPKEENVKASDIRPNLYIRTSKFQDISTNHRNKFGSLSMSPAVEKTLYVDTVNNAETSYKNSGFLDTKAQLKSASEDFEQLLEARGVEEQTCLESIFQDIKCLNNASKQSSLFGDSELGLTKEFSEMVSKGGNLDEDRDQILKEDSENVNASFVQSPLPPPLPKSPSESWLWRTMPSISLRNSFSHLKFGGKAQAKTLESNTSLSSTKWETIVKSSHLYHDHARYSEELVAHLSQQSKNY
ncbi:hypothetical protein PanWU01x14_030220 [Parasponia andersonii]|uniref:Uncharacterized protein n=1 Tax=Parasponia andersonii TaxID=3476 RepID=A0A2P5DUN7_PARAD|nr:hypothetical protein PanWU01x14_030220 [Parasponia andersonii]